MRLAGATRRLANAEDIARQAMTRGGREFDHVLASKAIFKEDAADAGRAVAAAGIAASQIGQAMGDHDLAMGGAVGAIRDASECSPIDEDTLRPAFACRTADGHRFVLQ